MGGGGNILEVVIVSFRQFDTNLYLPRKKDVGMAVGQFFDY